MVPLEPRSFLFLFIHSYGWLPHVFDIVIEDTLKVHDYMALVNVIEGAGGAISDKFGNEITTESQGSVVASANKELHSKLISLINE